MTSLSYEIAKAKAEEVNNISLDYHLSHATFACNLLIRKELQNINNEIVQELNRKKEEALSNSNIKEFLKLKIDQHEILTKNDKLQLYVEYLKHPDESEARTVRVGNHLIVYLSEKLLKKSRIDNRYTDAVVLLRQLMAHELGHAVLHTKELIEIKGTNGSAEFNGTGKEHEADAFSETLLNLRHARNMRMRNDRTLEYFF